MPKPRESILDSDQQNPKIISDLIAHGEVIEPWIGIIVQNIDAGLARI